MRITDQLIRYSLDDGLVIARAGGHRVFVMNASARFIWELLEAGIDAADIPSRMAAHFGIDVTQAMADVQATLEQWQREGLAHARPGRQRRYRLADIPFSITCSDSEIDAMISPVFGHLEIIESRQTNNIEAREFSVEADGSGFILLADGIELAHSAALDDILERLCSDIVMHSYERVDWFVSVHAAALGDANACIMLPGASGTGKSTLAACLLARGKLRLLTDDIALLDRTTMHVRPVPAPLVLKRGSWGLVNGFTRIESAPVHRRYGEDVRYLAPDRTQIADACLPVRAIIFPKRVSESTLNARPITQLEGLQRMLAAPATVKGPISEDILARLIEWSATVRFYLLAYATPEQATAAIHEIFFA
jgi:hypothetical protein